MEQQLVYLHTTKDLDQTEEILKANGMEIMFKADNFYLELSQMNEEEKLSWIDSIKGDLRTGLEFLTDTAINSEILMEQNNSLKKNIKEILNILETEPKNEIIASKYEQLLPLVDLYNKKLIIFDRNTQSYRRNHSLALSAIPLENKARCSCLIARRGGDVIKYLSFEEDPIISFSGPNASSLKSSLEKKF